MVAIFNAATTGCDFYKTVYKGLYAARSAIWWPYRGCRAAQQFDQRLHPAASIAGLLFLLSAAATALALRHRQPMLARVIAWPLLALLPTNSILAKSDLGDGKAALPGVGRSVDGSRTGAKAPDKARCWNNLGMANLVAQRA